MNGRFQQLVQLPRRVLSALIRRSAIYQVADDARRASKTGGESVKLTREIGKRTQRLESEVGDVRKDVRTVASELSELREQLNTRLLQYNLQLGRLSRIATGDGPEHATGNGPSSELRLSGRTVAHELDDENPPGWETVGNLAHPDPEGREWLLLDACPMCGGAERTIVNEWNKLVLLHKAPDPSSARYDFAVCHACGVTHATRRPIGARYRFLTLNFGEVIAKHGGGAEFNNPLLNPYPLTDADRLTLKERAAPGVFVSEHLRLRSNEYLDGLLKDRFDNSLHLDLIGALLSPRGARVLEIRPRTGMISEGLRRLFGAEVLAMPIWESQQFLLKQVYDIGSLGLVDYDQFDIPGDGQFDLIVCNHMLTHAVRPKSFFAAVHRHLKPGGHVYFYNEPDDAEYLTGSQSMLATLNPLHMQAFDMASFARGLAANGLEVTFHRRRHFSHISLARLVSTAFTPIDASSLQRRIKLYRRARDRAVLALRGDLRARFAEEWPSLVERGVAEGIVEIDARGDLRFVAR